MSLTIEDLGVEHLRHIIRSERERLTALDREISRLQDLQKTQHSCTALLHEYEVKLSEYENRNSDAEFFDTERRFPEELLLYTRAQIKQGFEGTPAPFELGRKGTVIGYSHAPTIYYSGMHWVVFDDAPIVGNRRRYDRVNIVHLQVIE